METVLAQSLNRYERLPAGEAATQNSVRPDEFPFCIHRKTVAAHKEGIGGIRTSEIQQLTTLFIFLVVILACLLTYFYKRVRQDLQELSGLPNRYRAHHETSLRRALSAPDSTERSQTAIVPVSPKPA